MKQNKIKNWHRFVGLLVLPMALTLQAAPVKIMFLGDSITEGDGSQPKAAELNVSNYTPGEHIPDANRIAYRGELWNILKDHNYTISGKKFNIDGTTPNPKYNKTASVDFVGSHYRSTSTFEATHPDFDDNHEGYAGFTTKELLEGRASNSTPAERGGINYILAKNTPDVVLLHIGTNDPGEHIDINDSVKNISAILDKIFVKNPKTKVLLARIIEARRAHVFGNHTWHTKKFNDAVEKMALKHKNTANIKVVNMETGAGMRYDPCGTALGDMQPHHNEDKNNYDLHPNKNGYTKMAQKWFDTLRDMKVLPDVEAPKITLVGANPYQVNIGALYVDPDITVTDDHDINPTVVKNITAVDTTKIGTYTVTYTVTDSAKRVATETRTVKVLALPDTDKNGIPDAHEKGWFTYDKVLKTATITPVNQGSQSILKSELEPKPSVAGNNISLTHTVSNTIKAYITADKNGLVHTGFRENSTDDSTLKMDTSYNAGTTSTIKKSGTQVFIETEVTLQANKSLLIGGK